MREIEYKVSLFRLLETLQIVLETVEEALGSSRDDVIGRSHDIYFTLETLLKLLQPEILTASDREQVEQIDVFATPAGEEE